MKKYEIAIRPYDRTEEGNIPYIVTVNSESPLGALALAFDIDEFEDNITDERARELLKDYGFEDEEITVENLSSRLEDFDPSDMFVFHIKELDSNKNILENLDINAWLIDEFSEDPVERGSKFDLEHPYLHSYLEHLNLYYEEDEEDDSYISNSLVENIDTPKYTAKRYSRWWWGILDNSENLYVRRPEDNTKLLLFKSKQEAEDWCSNNNSIITEDFEDDEKYGVFWNVTDDLDSPSNIEDMSYKLFDTKADADSFLIQKVNEIYNNSKSFKMFDVISDAPQNSTEIDPNDYIEFIVQIEPNKFLIVNEDVGLF